MKDIFKNLGKYQRIIIFFTIIFLFLGLINHAEAFYGSPTWNSDLTLGWGGPNNYFNYNSYQDYSNPYMYGPAMGVYYPYNTMFDVYNGGYAMNAGNPYNIYYDPAAFTFDLGLEASLGGIMNFWTGFFENLNEDDDND